MRILMSAAWITSYFYMLGMDATQHLKPMEWVKFLERTVARSSLGAREPSPFLQEEVSLFKRQCPFLSKFKAPLKIQDTRLSCYIISILCFCKKNYEMLFLVSYIKLF